MKVLMLPHYTAMGLNNGVGQVLYHYHKYLPQIGVELTTNENDNFDLSASHLGHYPNADVHFSHGLYFGKTNNAEAQTNSIIIDAIRRAKAIIVPSEYVAQTFRREARIQPCVIPHGIECENWTNSNKTGKYILWNKNRDSDVCNPKPIMELANRFPKLQFVSTFGDKAHNLEIIGLVPFSEMKPIIQNAAIYLATTKETFGIGTLEALASGIPVLGFNWGGTSDIITHKKDGYLVKPYDYDALSEGLEWLLANYKKVKSNCPEKAKKYDWLSVAQKIKVVFEDLL